MWAIHQPGSLGDVKSLSFICMKVCELSFVDIGVHRTRLIAIPVLRWVEVNRNRFYQSHASSVCSGHFDRISTMGGEFLDAILVREASKPIIVYNTTH